MNRRFRRVCLVFLLITAIVVFAAEYRVRTVHPAAYSNGNNAMWLRHSWVGEPHTDQEYKILVDMLHEMKISDAYFHVGPLNGDGTVPASKYINAPNLIYSIKRIDPHIHLYAWLGQVEAAAKGPLDLSDMKTRRTIIKTGELFLNLGFDGIHYDIEPVYSGNQYFLELVSTTHKLTRKTHKRLSVAANKPEPVPGLERVLRPFVRFPGYWTQAYFLRVAGQVDQVAVMMYDSGCPLPSVYAGETSWTVKWAISHGVNDLLIGVPTYENPTLTHHPSVENINNALCGLKWGVDAVAPVDRPKIGAAIYAEWTTSRLERQTYKSLWISPK